MDAAERRQLHDDLVALARGDRKRFNSIYERVRPLLQSYARKQLPAEAAEELAQQALLNVFVRVAEFDRERDALSWILGIAAWEIRTVRKRTVRRHEVGLSPPIERAMVDDSIEDQIILRDLQRATMELLESARPDDVKLIVEEAQDTRQGPASASHRKRLERARERLRGMWRAKHD